MDDTVIDNVRKLNQDKPTEELIASYKKPLGWRSVEYFEAIRQILIERQVSDPSLDLLTPKQDAADTQQSPTGAALDVGYHFRTLLGYGRFTSTVGWIAVALGLLVVFIGLVLPNNGAARFFPIIAGLVLIGFGFPLIIFGQVISCFVSIERNTRATYEVLCEKVPVRFHQSNDAPAQQERL